jgi:peptide chain release factor 1
VVEAYEKYKSAIDNLESARELLAAEKDEEMREMAKAEIDTLLQSLPDMEEDIRYLKECCHGDPCRHRRRRSQHLCR